MLINSMVSPGPFRSSGDLSERIMRVERHELPETTRNLIDDYESTIGERNRFLWKWLDLLFPEFTLSCARPVEEARLRDAKFLASLFVILLDDMAEKQMDRATFEEASKVPFEHQSADYTREGVDVDCLEFTERVWERFEEHLAGAPRRAEFAELFRFDLKQTINAIEYSYTLNRNLEMANMSEIDRYDCPNMMLFTYVNVDLMHSPDFETRDLSALRRVVLKAQRMARIGNWVTTWEREVGEGDYSSGVVVYALENGLVTAEELYALREGREEHDRIVDAIADHDVEDIFLHWWQQNYAEVKELEPAIESVDVGAFLDGMQNVMLYHLASKGLK